MSKHYPCGAVIAGEFEGSYIYRYNEDRLVISPNKTVVVSFGQVAAYIQQDIDKKTVKKIEVTGSEPKKADFANAGAMALLLSPVVGYAVHENSRGLLYTCSVTFRNGKKSLIKIDDSIYTFIQKLMFEISE